MSYSSWTSKVSIWMQRFGLEHFLLEFLSPLNNYFFIFQRKPVELFAACAKCTNVGPSKSISVKNGRHCQAFKEAEELEKCSWLNSGNSSFNSRDKSLLLRQSTSRRVSVMTANCQHKVEKHFVNRFVGVKTWWHGGMF